MPKISVRTRRLLAHSAAIAVIGASTAVLLVNPVTAPQAGAAVAPGSTVRASVQTIGGLQSEDSSQDQELAENGNSVVFSSFGKLDTLDSAEHRNVFVRDLVTRRTVMISRGQFNRQEPPVISAVPSTPPPDPGPRFGAGPMLNLNAAAQQQEEVPPNGDSFDPTISADGRFVAFVTRASNIIDEDAERFEDILVCDRDPDSDGVFDEPRAPGSTSLNYRYFRVNFPRYIDGPSTGRVDFPGLPKLSGDAGRIVWEEGSDNLDAGTRVRTALLRKTPTELPAAPATNDSVETPLPNRRVVEQSQPDISGDGRRIVLRVEYRPAGEAGGVRHQAIMLVNVPGPGAPNGNSIRVDFDEGRAPAPGQAPRFVSTIDTIFVQRPAINDDGTVIAFEAELYSSYECGEGQRCYFSESHQPNIYTVHLNANQTLNFSRISSRNAQGGLVNGFGPGLSGDGRYVTFVTDNFGVHDGVDAADGFSCLIPSDLTVTRKPMLNLAAGLPPVEEDRNNRTSCQVVVRDMVLDEELIPKETFIAATLVSPAAPNKNGNCVETLPAGGTCVGNNDSTPSQFSTPPSISKDGERIAYDSFASDLITEQDNNNRRDVFVRTMEPGLKATTFDFGPVEVGQSLTLSVPIEQTGAGPLLIQSVAVAGTNAVDFEIIGQNCTGATLHQTATCAVTIQFSPGAVGGRTGQLNIGVRGGRQFIVNLTGSGTAQPVPGGAEFSADPSPLSFGPRVLLSNGPESTVTITNTGESPLTVSSVTVVGPGAPADFTISSNGCIAAVPPGQLCKVFVKFSPKLPGSRTANLQFVDNAAGGPHLVGLSGSGNQPVITVSPGVTTPGRVVTVTGKDFPPGKTVTIKFDQRIGQSTVVAGADGTFRVPLLIFPKSTPENRTVLGTVDGFTDPLGRAPLLIVFPSVSPAEFVVRG